MALTRQPEPLTPAELISAALTDLGAIVRRAQAETLERDDFHALANRIRRRLKTARLMIAEPEPTIELTDLGAAIGRLMDAGLLTPAAELLPGVNRARTYGHLAVIDGDLSAPQQTTPSKEGA